MDTVDKYLNAEFEFRIFRVKLVVLPVDNVVTPVWSSLARTGVAAAGRISGNQLTLASTHRALASTIDIYIASTHRALAAGLLLP